ncbi:RNA dependent RNA polymerase-domain-containing protein [Mycena galericulata]|nr:RNA dependent RNA polymerase-domain-containing protein [Mycena galericulata]
MDSSQFSTEESDDWELWSSFDSSQTLFSSSPVPTPEDSATRRLKRKYDSEDFLEVPAKKIRTEAPKLSFTATTARNVEGTEPFIIVNTFVMSRLATHWIPTGVIWEIARLVSMGRLTGVSLEDLKQLKGDNKVAAPRVVETLLNEKVREIDAAFAAERKSQCPWAELDLEEKAIRLNPNAALGNCPSILKDTVENLYGRQHMTDGCGLSNPAFNLKLRRDFKLDSTPCAVQIRHGGRKGMLLMAPDSSRTQHTRVAFRKPSQIKINYSEEEKAPLRTQPWTSYAFPGGTKRRRDTPEYVQAVGCGGEERRRLPARRIRQTGSEIRFRGTGDRFADTTQDDDEEEPETFDKAVHERSTAWWPDYISGQPSSLAETVMGLIDAGFTPQALPVLRDKLKQVVKTKIKYRSQHFRYDVAHSASAFVVPDFWAVLREDEIHFKSSRREFKVIGDLETDIIVGEVLMTRNPCKVPTDVRKLRAVKHQALHDIVDLEIIVDAFVNADEKHSIEPAGVNACFTRDDTTVEKFIADNAQQPPEVKAMELQKYLLGSLRDASAVGQYSTYHDNSIVTRGYENPRTVKLAYQFCKILDSPKTGYKIKPKTRSEDQKNHGHPRGPAWKSREKEAKADGRANFTNSNFLVRTIKADNPMLSRPFIMEVLNQAAVRQEDRWLADAEQLFLPFETSAPILDRDLAQPWEQYLEFAAKHARAGYTKHNDDLAIIAEHVQRMYDRHSKEIKALSYPKDNSQRKSNSFTERKIEVRQDTLRMLSREFAAFPTADSLVTICDPVLIARLRASYAYLYDHRQYSGYGRKGWSRFPWDMALGELCRIKTAALGPNKAVSVRFYERFKIGGDKRT